jgi:hypothetical protein
MTLDDGGGGTRVGKSDDFALPAAKPKAAAAAKAVVSKAPVKKNSSQGGKPGKPAEKKDPREEQRLAQLESEAEVRAAVQDIVDQLARGLTIVQAVAEGNSYYAHLHLRELQAVPLRLLGSRVVGEPALSATRALVAACPGLTAAAFAVATALRHVMIAESGGAAAPGAEAVAAAVRMVATTAGDGGVLTASTYTLLFPLLAHAVLSDPHAVKAAAAAAFTLVAAHCDASVPGLPHQQTIPLLHKVMGAQGAHATVLQPLLDACCSTLQPEQLGEALDGLLAQEPQVRAAALASLHHVPCFAEGALPQSTLLSTRLFLALHDAHEPNVAAAQQLWDSYTEYGHGLNADDSVQLLAFLTHGNAATEATAARAVAAATRQFPDTTTATLAALGALFGEAGVRGRAAVAQAVAETARSLRAKDLPIVSSFLIKALRDGDDAVRAAVMAAGQTVLDTHGAEHVALLLPVFESCLDRDDAAASGGALSYEQEAEADRVREGIAVFLGTLARHLPQGDPKVAVVVQRLMEVLRTPSEPVQRAVANCFPGLMGNLTQEAKDALVAQLVDRTLHDDKYAGRRGGSFGLAGAVKGIGFSALKANGIMDALKEAVENEKQPAAREGGLLAFECLCERLGRLFEPYVTKILPVLLVCFGDVNAPVREACDLAAKAIMANLSGQGVKLVLPALLKGLEEKKWGTKVGSVQLLAAMAFCAPKQLSSCLPTIVPRLSEVLNDTHPKVQRASALALQQVGSVIRNPEVQNLVPALLAAIERPNDNTRECLDTLLDTVFVNTVDAASLALIVPVLNRALRERTTEIKKKAAKIVGNMSSLINEAKDMMPYVPLLLPELKKVLIDPSPEVRATAARALGALVQGMGEESFPDLIPWMLDTIRADTTNVERAGAALGLAEVLAVLGPERVDVMLPDIIAGSANKAVSVRDGNLMLLRYLPATLGASYQNQVRVSSSLRAAGGRGTAGRRTRPGEGRLGGQGG